MDAVTAWTRLQFLGWNFDFCAKNFSIYFYARILSDYGELACMKWHFKSSFCVNRNAVYGRNVNEDFKEKYRS